MIKTNGPLVVLEYHCPNCAKKLITKTSAVHVEDRFVCVNCHFPYWVKWNARNPHSVVISKAKIRKYKGNKKKVVKYKKECVTPGCNNNNAIGGLCHVCYDNKYNKQYV